MNGDSGQNLPRRFEQMQRAQRIDFEIEERDGRRAVVRGLGGGVDDQRRAQFLQTSARTPSRSRISSAWWQISGDLAAFRRL